MVKHGSVQIECMQCSWRNRERSYISSREREYSTIVAARGIPEHLKVIVKRGWKILNRYLNIEELWREGLRRQASFLIIEDNPHVERPPSLSTEVVLSENNSHASRMVKIDSFIEG